MNRNKVIYILVGVVIAFASMAFIIGVVYPALADGTIYLPLISGSRSNIDSAANKSGQSLPTDTPTPGLKPGEYPGFVPTPVPEIPLPPGVEPVTPGAPEEGKPRPSQEELEKLLPAPLPPDAPFQLHVVYDGMPVSSESSALETEIIVIAKVQQIHPAQWTTQDGKRPPNPHDNTAPSTIFTRVDLKVEEVLGGDAQPNNILTLLQNGGTIGQDFLIVEDSYPAFAEGQTLLLYLTALDLTKETDRYAGMPDKIWMTNGRYLIDPSTNLAANPYEQRPLEDMLVEIRRVQEQKAAPQ